MARMRTRLQVAQAARQSATSTSAGPDCTVRVRRRRSSSSRRSTVRDPTLASVREARETRTRAAVKAIALQGCRDNGRPIYPFRRAALDFDVSYRTLMRRFRGAKDNKAAHQHQQILTPPQERVVVGFVKVLGRRGIPVTRALLRDKVSSIVGHEVSLLWVYRFMVRNPDIQRRWTVEFETHRAKAFNRTIAEGFYDQIQYIQDTYNVPPERIYNMDEKGVQMGIGSRVRGIVDQMQKSPFALSDGNKEMVTMVECVCADGSAIAPMAIFKGARTNPLWGENNPAGAA